MFDRLSYDMWLLPYLAVTLSAVLGYFIGLERKGLGKHVGPRTYSIICLGSCVFTLISIIVEPQYSAGFRIAAQVVVGIGFLGAGVIWRAQENIQGITTAASIWTTAAVGMLIGFGFIPLSVYTTLLILFILRCKNKKTC